MDQKISFSLSSITKNSVDLLVYAITLPWLPVLSAWLLSAAVMIILNTESAIRLGDIVPGDYSNFFTYISSWLLMSVIVFSSLIINFIWFKNNKTHEVISICILFFLFGSFAFILWPEIDAFLKLRNIV